MTAQLDENLILGDGTRKSMNFCLPLSLRVVLQGFMPARLFSSIKSVALDGFCKYPDGSVRPMPDDEFYAFD